MSVSWVQGFDPNYIAERIAKSANIDEEGNVSYSGFEMFEHQAVLQNMLSFPDDVPDPEKRSIIHRALNAAVMAPPINPQRILSRAQRELNSYYAKPTQPFVLLTQASLQRGVSIPTTRPKGVTVTFNSSPSANFLQSRSALQDEAERTLRYEAPFTYAFVRVFVRARSAFEAANAALDGLDLARGILNFLENRRHTTRMSFGGIAKPVNKIVLGPFHTLHEPSGDLATNTWWYEPNYSGPLRTYSGPRNASISDLYQNFRDILYSHPYRRDLEDAIIQYGRALDEADHEAAFQRLWVVLEDLTSTDSGYKLTIRRASFLFQEHMYHRQILYHLKEFRNARIHEDATSDSVEAYLYQLKNYVEALLQFHLITGSKFDSIREASDFMDMPPDLEEIARRKEVLERAHEFRSTS